MTEFFSAREWGSCKEDQWRKGESQHWIQAIGNPNTGGKWQDFPLMGWYSWTMQSLCVYKYQC